MNKWTKVVKAEENKIRIDIDAVKFCASFEYDAKMLAHDLAYTNKAGKFVNDRIKKISIKVFDMFESNDTYGELFTNNYISETEEIESYDRIFLPTYFGISNKLEKIIKEMGENISKYDADMGKIINNLKQNKNNDKIIEQLQIFRNTIIQFYRILRDGGKVYQTEYFVELFDEDGGTTGSEPYKSFEEAKKVLERVRKNRDMYIDQGYTGEGKITVCEIDEDGEMKNERTLKKFWL